MADKTVGFSERDAGRVASTVHFAEHNNGGPLNDRTLDRRDPQAIRRVKLLEDLTDDNFVTGTLQIQKDIGGVVWVDTDIIIPNIYKGHPDQPDLEVGDIVWIISSRGRWYVLMVEGDDLFPGPDGGCCAGCVCMGDLTITSCGSVPCLAEQYRVVIGHPWNGETVLDHVSGCVYESDAFDITLCEGTPLERVLGSYFWRLTVASGIDTCVLTLIGSPDLHVDYRNKWHFDGACGNTFGFIPDCAIEEDVKANIPCEVCVAPVGELCASCEPPDALVDCGDDIYTVPGTLHVEFTAPNCPAVDGKTFDIAYTGHVLVGGFLRANWQGTFDIGACSSQLFRFQIAEPDCNYWAGFPCWGNIDASGPVGGSWGHTTFPFVDEICGPSHAQVDTATYPACAAPCIGGPGGCTSGSPAISVRVFA